MTDKSASVIIKLIQLNLQMVNLLCGMLLDNGDSDPNASNLRPSDTPTPPKGAEKGYVAQRRRNKWKMAEKHAERAEKRHKRVNNHPGYVTCSKCGRHGRNVRTCIAKVDADEGHWAYQQHRRPITWARKK